MYKQKVKHLLYEHQNNLDELKTENMVVIKRTEEEHRKSENELRKDKRSLKVINKDQELSHEDADKDLRLVIFFLLYYCFCVLVHYLYI